MATNTFSPHETIHSDPLSDTPTYRHLHSLAKSISEEALRAFIQSNVGRTLPLNGQYNLRIEEVVDFRCIIQPLRPGEEDRDSQSTDLSGSTASTTGHQAYRCYHIGRLLFNSSDVDLPFAIVIAVPNSELAFWEYTPGAMGYVMALYHPFDLHNILCREPGQRRGCLLIYDDVSFIVCSPNGEFDASNAGSHGFKLAFPSGPGSKYEFVEDMPFDELVALCHTTSAGHNPRLNAVDVLRMQYRYRCHNSSIHRRPSRYPDWPTLWEVVQRVDLDTSVEEVNDIHRTVSDHYSIPWPRQSIRFTVGSKPAEGMFLCPMSKTLMLDLETESGCSPQPTSEIKSGHRIIDWHNVSGLFQNTSCCAEAGIETILPNASELQEPVEYGALIKLCYADETRILLPVARLTHSEAIDLGLVLGKCLKTSKFFVLRTHEEDDGNFGVEPEDYDEFVRNARCRPEVLASPLRSLAWEELVEVAEINDWRDVRGEKLRVGDVHIYRVYKAPSQLD